MSGVTWPFVELAAEDGVIDIPSCLHKPLGRVCDDEGSISRPPDELLAAGRDMGMRHFLPLGDASALCATHKVTRVMHQPLCPIDGSSPCLAMHMALQGTEAL